MMTTQTLEDMTDEEFAAQLAADYQLEAEEAAENLAYDRWLEAQFWVTSFSECYW